jgi:hypothetical protein
MYVVTLGHFKSSTNDHQERAAIEEPIGNDLEKHLTRKSTKNQAFLQEVFPLTDLDNDLVGWDSQSDPANPRNFPQKTKWFILTLISAITFLSPLASSILAPGIPFVNKDFGNTSQLLGAFAVSVFVLGFCVSVSRSVESGCVLMCNRSGRFSSVRTTILQTALPR